MKTRVRCIILSLLAGIACGQTVDEQDRQKSLSEAAASVAGELPKGCLVTAESLNGVVEFRGLGELPDGGREKPEDVVFEIGSITKVFNGLLLATMVIAGEVSLDDTIGELLGRGSRFADPQVAEITLLQLVTHTSGLPRLPQDLAIGGINEDPYAHYDEDRLFRYLRETSLEGEGPYESSYSNLGAGVLGCLLSKRVGRPWMELVEERICEPLGLENTGIKLENADRVKAPPFSGESDGHSWHLNAFRSAGALHSTAADLVRFGQAFLNPESTELAEAIRLTCEPHAEARAVGGQIGLGLFIGKRFGQTIWNHSGGTGGYRSFLQIEPEDQRVMVVLVNNAAFEPGRVLKARAPDAERSTSARQEVSLTEPQLSRYPGVYELDSNARFTVLPRDGGLWIRLTGQTFLKAFPMGGDRFFLKVVEAEFQFDQGREAAKTLTLFQNGGELEAKRSDQPIPKVMFRSPKELQAYVGDYAVVGGSKFEIRMRGGTLFAKLADQQALPVFEVGKDQFEYEVVQAKLTFTRDEDEAVNGLVLHQNGATLPAAKERK